MKNLPSRKDQNALSKVENSMSLVDKLMAERKKRLAQAPSLTLEWWNSLEPIVQKALYANVKVWEKGYDLFEMTSQEREKEFGKKEIQFSATMKSYIAVRFQS